MLTIILQSTLICAITLFLWKYFRHLIVTNGVDNIPGPPSPSFVWGHLRQIRNQQHGWAFHREWAEKYGSVARLHAPFGRALLFVRDPKAIYHIAVKDQESFPEPVWFLRLNLRVFGPGLLATDGGHHRKQRKLLNPVFSVNHMRHMLPIFHSVTNKLEEAIRNRLQDGPDELNMSMWMGRAALELVGVGALGYSFDPLVEDKDDVLGDAIKNLMPAIAQVGAFFTLLPAVEAVVPKKLLRPLANLVPFEPLHRLMKLSDTIHEKSLEVFNAKKATLAQGDEAVKQQVGEGKDIMSILLRANMASSAEEKLSDEELLAQMSTLTFAAMDTTSNALSLTLWLLAQHPDVQERLRREILDAQDAHGSKDLAYDDLVALPYLDAVCRETLRWHVPAPMRFREAREDIVLPLFTPVRGLDGQLMHEIPVSKGTPVFVSIGSSNTDPAIWGPDAHEWKPERWLAPLPESVHDAKMPGIYSNLMTFWAGGRACIGFKFSQLEMKAVLAMLLSTFTFEIERPIYWMLAGVIYPTTQMQGGEPMMPMKVGLWKPRKV